MGQFVIGHLVIGQFVIGQFNKPITFKVVVKIKQSHLKCSLNQPITTLVSITIEASVQTPKLGLSSKWRILSLEQWLYFRRQWRFLLSYGTNLYANYPDEFLCGYVDMFRWSSPHHSIVLYRFATTAANGGKHPLDWNTTAQYASISSLQNPQFVQQNTRTTAVDQAKFSPCIGRRNSSEINNSKPQPPKHRSTEQLNHGWQHR